MTKLVIQGKNVEITDAIRSYVQEKNRAGCQTFCPDHQ